MLPSPILPHLKGEPRFPWLLAGQWRSSKENGQRVKLTNIHLGIAARVDPLRFAHILVIILDIQYW